MSDESNSDETPSRAEQWVEDMAAAGEPHWIVLGSIIGLIVGGSLLRSWLGLEWDATSIREMVLGFGLWGPLLLIGLLAIRFVLFIPSILLLTAGGLVFGAATGTLYGALGLTLAGLLKFGVVHWAGAEAIRAHVPQQYGEIIRLARSKAGTGLIGLVSAYPAGPIGIVHIAAAIAGMTLLPFTLSVFAGSLVRAGIFSFFGSQLVDGDTWLWSAALLVATVVLPLAFKPSRVWLLKIMGFGAREQRGRGDTQ
ncbi:MAG: TVP38/TMEM64 family protein [bacterium]|nr:TVP38/TMEM64 family protein [bacterium]